MSKTILFVCRGNAFRSILADAYLKSKQLSNIKVLSAGTVATQYYEQNGVDFNANMADYAAAHGIGNFIKDHYGDQLTQELLDSAANITGSITRGKFLVDKLSAVLVVGFTQVLFC